MSTLKAGKLQHPDAANSSIEFDASGNITKFVGPSGGADGNVLTKSGTTTAWAAPAGLVWIATESFSAVTTLSVNNVFTSSYLNYRLVINAVANNVDLVLRLRASGTDNTSSDYRRGRYFVGLNNSVSAGSSNNDTQTNITLANLINNDNVCSVDIYNPHSAVNTLTTSFAAGSLTQVIGGSLLNSTSYDGFTLFNSGAINMTGVVRIYGYRNS